MRAFLLAALSALSLAGPAMAQTPAFPDDAAILDILKSRIDDGRANGLVLGLMEADGTTRILAQGDAGPGASPLGPDTVFEIGSITKVFTTTLLADMALKGEVALDAPAQQYAPPGMVLPTRNGKHITLAHLAEQNSGLPRLPLNMSLENLANPYADYTVAQLNAFLATHQLGRDPGEAIEYSNLGIGVLGAILAHRAGQTYEELVQARILRPLGMTSSGITLTPHMQANLAVGHDAAGKPTPLWDLPTLAGAGALRSTMTDMLKFLAANTGEPANDLERAMRLAQAPRFNMPGSARIGLGWITLKTPRGSFIYHDGGTGGFGSLIGIDTTRNVGLVLLANRTGVPEDIALHLMDKAIPLSPPPSNNRTEIAVPADVLAAHVGVYALDAMKTFKLTVTLEGGQLHMQATGQDRFPIFPESQTKFFLKVVDAQVTFAADHLILHQGGADQRATKE
jgi:D-alanyl-D-alanine-carboxypeptidase/D-alanyl-D-alanine-endopeptidase